MKNIFLILILFAGSSVFAQSVYYENPNLVKPITIFSSKFAASTPFWIKIGKTKYYLVRNRKDGNYSYKDLVGCDKAKRQLFQPLYVLDNDGDPMVLTSDELKKNGIRFVSVKTNGKLELADKSKDFPIEDIDYIDMITVMTSVDTFLRPYGKFTLYMKTESGNMKKYIGHAGYEHPRILEKLF